MSFPGEGIASSLIAGGLNYVGQREANRMNRELAREQMRFQRESTDKLMAFQERMSNTAYQRAVADLEAAGLNPMLAYMQGGAGSPAGASSGGSTAHMKSTTAEAVQAATAARQASANVQQTKIMAELLKAQLPEAKAKAKFWEKHGEFLPIFKLFSEGASSAASIFRMFR